MTILVPLESYCYNIYFCALTFQIPVLGSLGSGDVFVVTTYLDKGWERWVSEEAQGLSEPNTDMIIAKMVLEPIMDLCSCYKAWV